MKIKQKLEDNSNNNSNNNNNNKQDIMMMVQISPENIILTHSMPSQIYLNFFINMFPCNKYDTFVSYDNF